ncbi:MAG: type IV toxin-antitoxin system AbiEi family antitoxin domain-containing protein [Candidatus Harrisonbacteria bacterium]|nr:type IV toxin-antitoxin system AbiEi family antitoxin domain-containing protein [Candidatus Harrisonbacteria bacterium]
MRDILILLFVALVGILLGRYFALLRINRNFRDFEKQRRKLVEESEKKIHPEVLTEGRKGDFNQLNEYRHEAMEHNLEKVMELAHQKEFITNDDIEHSLGLSNATAERYLNELEKRGKLEQIGERGQGVKYREQA